MPKSDLYWRIKRGEIRVIWTSRNVSPPEYRYWASVDKDGPVIYEHLGKCWKWLGHKNKDGYGQIWINGVSVKAHRYSYTLHKGEIPDGLLVLHHCDNGQCTNPKHLYLGTDADNVKDRDNRNRVKHAAGEKHGRAKANESIVMDILMEYQSNDRKRGLKPLAERYGINFTTVGRIVRGDTWKEVYSCWVDMGRPKK